MADLLVLPRPAKSLQNGAGFSLETCKHWACQYQRFASTPLSELLARTPEPYFLKEKGVSGLSKSRGREFGESWDGQEQYLGEKEEGQSEGIECMSSWNVYIGAF